MGKQKINTLKEVGKISKRLRGGGKTVGLITGCFDILHAGHLDLFEFAKRKVDVLIIGIDNDRSINISKGKDRPFNKQKDRVRMLSALENIDCVFVISNVYKFSSQEAQEIHEHIYNTIGPTYLITSPLADKFWEIKMERLANTDSKLLLDRRKKVISSTKLGEVMSNR